jgi:flagellar motor switch protein FliN
MKTFLACWVEAATVLFAQALAGEPELAESLPKPLAAGSFGFAAALSGDQTGRFVVVLDGSVLESPLLGEGVDQKAGWGELLREVADSAAGELLARTGHKCRVEKFEETPGGGQISQAFQLKSGDHSWTILVRDEVRAPKQDVQAPAQSVDSRAVPPIGRETGTTLNQGPALSPGAALSPGIELLLDVELEATLRFGCREMPLGEILDLGPGDVVQLDRHVSDPVDLVVGDKIVARGEVVLLQGNFGLRVTEVAAPRKRLESIRCLF